MRVGLDAREAYRRNPRGIGLYQRHLVREFGALAPQDEFWLYHEREAPPDLGPLPANAHPRRTTMRGGRLHLWERIALPWRLRRDRMDVHHGTFNTLPPRWRAWPGPPLVVTIHDLIVTWWDQDLDDPWVRYCRAVTPRTARDARVIVTVSDWSRGDIVERLRVDPAKVRVVHNGVHPDFLAGAPPGAGAAARARFADGRAYVFTVGSSLERKNTAALLDAMARLHERGFEHLLLIAGLDERQQAPFAARATGLGIEPVTRFLPYLSRTELIAVYAGADLTVYPSLMEGWGIPVVESLALGTPVATSLATAMPEAGGPHATYFDPRDPADMAAKIAQALAGKEAFAAVRAAAMARARSFTWPRHAAQLLEIYREVGA